MTSPLTSISANTCSRHTPTCPVPGVKSGHRIKMSRGVVPHLEPPPHWGMAHTFVPDSDLAQAQENIRVEFALPGLAWAVVPLEAPVTAGASGTRRVNLP